MISSSLATTAVRRSLSRRYSAKKVKPPEAIATFQPSVSSLSTSCVKPGISGRFSRTCCRILASAPFSVATRLRRLAVKSSSPRIARSVTSATISPVPASLAISSIHSIWMAVESMSITSKPGVRRCGIFPSGATSSCASWARRVARAVSEPARRIT
ncbi:Uncharacterised protein [Shigella sonnei]|nr:Uncharacterised protein [Shigella sonnei]